MQCLKCGAKLNDKALVCNKCGFIMKGAKALSPEQAAEKEQSVAVAPKKEQKAAYVTSTQPIQEGHCYKCGAKLKGKGEICHKCGFIMKGARVLSAEEVQQADAKQAAAAASTVSVANAQDVDAQKLVKVGKAWATWTLVFGILACVLLIVPGINILAAAVLFVLSFIGFSNAKGQNGGVALAGIIMTVVAICGSWFYNANYAEKVGTSLGLIKVEQTSEQQAETGETGTPDSSDIDLFGNAVGNTNINIELNTDVSADTTTDATVDEGTTETGDAAQEQTQDEAVA